MADAVAVQETGRDLSAGELREALKAVAAAADPDMPNLSGLLYMEAPADGTLVLSALNSAWGVRVVIPWGRSRFEPLLVDAKLFERLVASWGSSSAPVQMEVAEGGLHVRCGLTRARLVVGSAELWPEPDRPKEIVARASVEAQELARALRRVVPAADPKAVGRPAMASVKIEVSADTGLTLVATDSSRLHYDRVGGLRAEGEGEALVPVKAVNGLLRWLDTMAPHAAVDLSLASRLLLAEAPARRFWTHLVEASFPRQIGHLLEDGPVTVKLLARGLAAATTRLALFADPRQPAVVGFYPNGEGGLVLRAATAERGEAEESVEVLDGSWPEHLQIHYQARYIQGALECADGESVFLSIDPGTGRAVMRQEGRPWRAVMMSWRTTP